MRLVLDMNQVDHVVNSPPTNEFSPTFVLPALVWAEIARSGEFRRRIDGLAKHDLLFGADVVHFLSALRLMTEVQVKSASPVYRTIGDAHEHLLADFIETSEPFRQRAAKFKEECDRSALELIERGRGYAAEHHKLKSQGKTLEFVKWSTIDDAEAILLADYDATWARETLNLITDNGQQPIAAKSEASLFQAIMAHPSIRLWMRVCITQSFGYYHCWTDQLLNSQPNGNDVTDITLPLYARPGDVILTNDQKLKRTVAHCDMEGPIRVMTWRGYQEWRERGFD